MRHVSIYLPREILDQVMAEAERLERSPAWLLQQAWRIARVKLQAAPVLEDDQ